jgi:hypothetical protein
MLNTGNTRNFTGELFFDLYEFTYFAYHLAVCEYGRNTTSNPVVLRCPANALNMESDGLARRTLV